MTEQEEIGNEKVVLHDDGSPVAQASSPPASRALVVICLVVASCVASAVLVFLFFFTISDELAERLWARSSQRPLYTLMLFFVPLSAVIVLIAWQLVLKREWSRKLRRGHCVVLLCLGVLTTCPGLVCADPVATLIRGKPMNHLRPEIFEKVTSSYGRNWSVMQGRKAWFRMKGELHASGCRAVVARERRISMPFSSTESEDRLGDGQCKTLENWTHVRCGSLGVNEGFECLVCAETLRTVDHQDNALVVAPNCEGEATHIMTVNMQILSIIGLLQNPSM